MGKNVKSRKKIPEVYSSKIITTIVICLMSFPMTKFSDLLNPLITFIFLIKNLGAIIQLSFTKGQQSLSSCNSEVQKYPWGLSFFWPTTVGVFLCFQMTFPRMTAYIIFSINPQRNCEMTKTQMICLGV